MRAGVLHLGVGAFHRAHQAVYLDDLLAADPRWGVVGASLRSSDMADALAPQNQLYTVVVDGPGGPRFRIVGALLEVLVARTAMERLLERLADPAIALVTLTVTEKGYGRDAATGALDEHAPDVAADLTAEPGARMRSVPGLLTEGLARRRAAGAPAPTLLSCDNLPENGAALRRVLLEFAARRDPALAEWIDRSVAFPSAMVDRIVPAATDADRAAVAAALGVEDAWPVRTEPFSQWVIEDRFAGERPAFETVGVEMVANVAPYERMKLRMLNGAHSTLAYLGRLAGLETVAETMAAPEIRALVEGLMRREAAPTVGLPAVGLDAYADRLIERFDNPALRHRTEQIAMDGSQKLPQRLLGTIADNLAAGRPIARAALGVAAWMRCVAGLDDAGRPLALNDPMAATLRAAVDAAPRERLAAALLDVHAVFGELGRRPDLRAEIAAKLDLIAERGARGAAAAVASAAA